MSRRWYLLTFAPIAIGGVIAAFLLVGMTDKIKTMQRVVVPGRGDLQLDAGEYVIYGEAQGIYDDVPFTVRCGLAAADGAPVQLETSGSTLSYKTRGYEGRSIFRFMAPVRGTYHLACEGEESPVVLAVGHGLGTGFVIAIVAGLGGLAGAVYVFFVIRGKRSLDAE